MATPSKLQVSRSRSLSPSLFSFLSLFINFFFYRVSEISVNLEGKYKIGLKSPSFASIINSLFILITFLINYGQVFSWRVASFLPTDLNEIECY